MDIDHEARQRLRQLEKQMTFLLRELGLEEKAQDALANAGPELSEIYRYLQSGNKIMAVKIYREQTGCGLKEAKDAVDRLERGY
ncbi:MAG: ribosomal protein L7/L12 [Ktedonobacteraceae bacterium]|nr:ribosomal protein L7/L12 [Ktedonobacteraceae bacterium]